MFRFEFPDFEFNCHKAGQSPVIEQQINIKITVSYLYSIFLTDKGEIFAKFQNELLQIFDNRLFEATFSKLLRQIKKFQHIGVQNAAAHILWGRSPAWAFGWTTYTVHNMRCRFGALIPAKNTVLLHRAADKSAIPQRTWRQIGFAGGSSN